MDDSGVSQSGMERCDQVRAAAAEGRLHEHPELQAHVSGCEVCQALTAASPVLERAAKNANRSAGSVLDAEASFRALERELDGERGPAAFLRSQKTQLRRAVVLGLLLVLFVALYFAKPERPLESDDLLHRRAGLVALLGLLLAGSYLALAPIHRTQLSARARRALTVVALAAALVIGLAPTVGFWTDPSAPWIRSVGLPCLAFGLAIAVPVYFAMRLFDREPAGPSLFLSAMAAGVAGDLALHLRCMHRDAQHFLIGHFGVISFCLFAATLWSRLSPALKGAGPRSP